MLKKFISVSAVFALFFFFSIGQAQSMHPTKKIKKMTASSGKFEATLSGKNVVPPVKTKATGEATFNFSKDGKSLFYKLTVHNVDNVIMAHIHHAAPGKDGPIAVWLYKGKPSGVVNGVLSKGVITDKIINLDSLKTWIKNGDAYVLVHTKAYPNGEIRGTIKSK